MTIKNRARRGEITPEQLRTWLARDATTQERVHALLAIGIPAAHLADAVGGGVTVSTLRNWSTGQAEPRPDTAIALDDLRTAAWLLLVEGGMERERVGRWLLSRDPKTRERPIDRIATAPTDVFADAMGEVMPMKLANDERLDEHIRSGQDTGEQHGDTQEFTAVPSG